MTRTRLVLDLPTPEGIRVVIVDDDQVVNVCLAMVLARFGALITSAPATMVSGMIATPHARLTEIAADEGEAYAVVQKPRRGPGGNSTVELTTPGPKGYRGPGRAGQSGEVSFEISLTNSTAALALALSITDLDPLSN